VQEPVTLLDEASAVPCRTVSVLAAPP
jgi:hypothetical protein